MGKKRVLYAIVGVVVMLFAGFVYAWSVLSSFIAADYPAWSSGSLSLTFTICMAFFCLGGLASGILSKRIAVRFNVIISAVLFFFGFSMASRAFSLAGLYIGYGVLCGSASGFAYNSVLNIMPRWFPDNPGLISGVLLMGFGSSSLIIGTMFTYFTSMEAGAWRDSFLFLGVLISITILVCSLFFKTPKPDEFLRTKESGDKNKNASDQGLELSSGQMLRRSGFWTFFIWSTLLSGMGLAIIAQAKPIASMISTGLSAGAISLIVGLISVFNGLGRIIMGGMFDKSGRKITMYAINIISLVCALLLIAALALKSLPLVIAGFLGSGIAYGGCPTMSASFIRLFYGQKNYPVNLSVMNLNLLAASFFGTIAGILYDASGSYMTTFIALTGCALISLIILPRIKRP